MSTAPEVSAVIVTYHSSGVLGAAVESLRREAARAGVGIELVVVDHSEDEAEQRRLEAHHPDRLLLRRNRGFAAGVNAGLEVAAAPTLLVANPDIVLEEGALGGLLAALSSGWDVVGPQLELGGWLFPPADRQTPFEHLERVLASHSWWLWRRRLGAELGRCRRVWDSGDPASVANLSGALILFSRALASKVGPWDEGYFLFFEETDWLLRARRCGARLGLVPKARMLHCWGHAADPLGTGNVYEASRRRFMAAHHAVSYGLAHLVPLGGVPHGLPRWSDQRPERAEEKRWWLLSPSPLGLPAAGVRGNVAELEAALHRLATARPQKHAYVLTALDPASERWAGSWSWRTGHE